MQRSIIFTLLSLHPLAAYSFLFFGMIIEGDLFLFTTGFLVHRQALDLGDALWLILLGTILGDYLWYSLGRVNTSRNRFLAWLGRRADTVGKPVDTHLKERTFRTLFVSKFIYGAHHFTLVRAGRLGISLRQFIWKDTGAILLWVLIVGGIGYLASASFENFRRHLHFAELTLLLGVVSYFILAELVSRLLKRKL